MSDLPYLKQTTVFVVKAGVMPMCFAHEVAKNPSHYLMSDIEEALRVLSARIRAMEATVIMGCSCCDEDEPPKTLSSEEVFEIMEGW